MFDSLACRVGPSAACPRAKVSPFTEEIAVNSSLAWDDNDRSGCIASFPTQHYRGETTRIGTVTLRSSRALSAALLLRRR
jgi:hypothetical protein